MKKFILTILITLLSIGTYTAHAQTTELLFFYSNTCPHCHKENIFLEKMELKYPEIVIKRYEVSQDKDNQKLFEATADKLGQIATSVPFLVLNDQVIIGYQSDLMTGRKIETEIKRLLQQDNTAGTSGNNMEIQVFGKTIDPKALSIPVLTIVIGILDGFNPCAMWVLLFLIGMLLGTENKRRLYLLGGTFILTSGVIYFLFLSAWLNIFLFIGYTSLLKILIGGVALAMGARYLNEYRKHVTGCEVTSNEKRQAMFARIKNIINKNNLGLALLGIILLSIAVNFVELLCSAGLPAVYTQVLMMNNLPTWQYYAYLILYVFFFMLDDLIVFIIAMVTLETVGISAKYTHISHLVGGIVMILIGILMLFKPELLMLR